ncbi:hypothetical protein ALI144C_02570 [Actinosynnema sp. ALI-1.44]|uniref:hypothetical protein n=1 Tax=Actinosynnema sp. ALI-1.44 TaxID=1933779 RepID=UPI00097BCBDD|nr:hypothetical protein [Actinosynnema sp. ALI-1.44]ONI90584.1 hypothetical protein ALI144C_02570 [Actinosynnema sp. ALI-1.44]
MTLSSRRNAALQTATARHTEPGRALTGLPKATFDRAIHMGSLFVDAKTGGERSVGGRQVTVDGHALDE